MRRFVVAVAKFVQDAIGRTVEWLGAGWDEGLADNLELLCN